MTPGENYLSYSEETTRQVWVTQSQSTCYTNRDRLEMTMLQNRYLEGQMRYLKCGKNLIFVFLEYISW